MHSSVHTVDSIHSQKIVHDQLNRSHSKQQFTFPKTERFAATKKIYCQSASYQLGTTLNKRSTNLGYGTKSDFTKIDLNKPGPDRYSVGSVFEVEKSKKKGFTFCLGREEIKFRNISNIKPTPGPGCYALDDSQKSKQFIFSMGRRTVHPYVPGPAEYELSGINKTGNYFVSKYSGSKASVISPPTSTRFSYQTRGRYIPGPGAYNFETFTNEGKYYNSKLRSAAGGKFSIQPRQTYNNSKDALISPGPGAYRALSEFGDTDFPPIKGSPKINISRSQSVFSFRNQSTMRSTGKQQSNNNLRLISQQPNFHTKKSQQSNNNHNYQNKQFLKK